MTIRVAFIGAAMIVLSGSSANAQARQPRQVVLSETALKSMVANKTKSKTPLTARLGMVRRSSAVPTMPGRAAPTAVREISKKK